MNCSAFFGAGLPLFAWLAHAPLATQAQAVGIGTASPSTNAALDVYSTTKGLMLPRLPTTASVANPSAGLVVYDKKLQAPAYHDGTRWNTLAAASRTAATAGQPDSVTYVITGGGTGFTTLALGTITDLGTGMTSNFTNGGGGSGRPTFQELTISKYLDDNSIALANSVPNGRVIPTIEFKVFVPGAATPSYSVKLTSVHVTGYAVKVAAGTVLTEQLIFAYTRIGYKNWITGQSFGWDVTRNISTGY